jgi:hypothetical protein
VTWRQRLWTVVAVGVALAIGWVWGASDRSSVELARQTLEDRADLAEAREFALDARLHIVALNFGEAATSLDGAERTVERLQLRWRHSGQIEKAGQLEIVLSHVKDARRLAGAADRTAEDPTVQSADLLQVLANATSSPSPSPPR